MSTVSFKRASLSDSIKYNSFLAGNDAFVPSALVLLESTVLTATATTVTFTNLNSTYGSDYAHLQLRTSVREDTTETNMRNLEMQFNDDTGSNTQHNFRYARERDGTHQTAQALNNDTVVFGNSVTGGNTSGGNFGATVIDILDPFESGKKTSVFGMGGGYTAAENVFSATSGYHSRTEVLDTITLLLPNLATDFAVGSRFSLYGIKEA